MTNPKTISDAGNILPGTGQEHVKRENRRAPNRRRTIHGRSLAADVARPCAQSSLQRIEQRPAWPFVFLRRANQYHKVLVSDILFLEAEGAYTQVFTAGSGQFLISSNLKKVLCSLGHPELLRVNRSQAVNLCHVERVEERHTLRLGGRSFALGPHWREDFFGQAPFL